MFSGQFYGKWKSVIERNIKLVLEAVTYMAITETATYIITTNSNVHNALSKISPA